MNKVWRTYSGWKDARHCTSILHPLHWIARNWDFWLDVVLVETHLLMLLKNQRVFMRLNEINRTIVSLHCSLLQQKYTVLHVRSSLCFSMGISEIKRITKLNADLSFHITFDVTLGFSSGLTKHANTHPDFVFDNVSFFESFAGTPNLFKQSCLRIWNGKPNEILK